VSHGQAFHTSCRTGLGGTAGFQVNAASDGLDRAQLAAMVAAHARYDAPRDLPFEPTPEQMRDFPVALRMTVVPDVGPVVSRTAYVGREYRGADGAPDEGRFGNYFCHMVVGAAGDEAFGGLYAIELWDAPHWTTDEACTPALPSLDGLAPGPLDLQRVLETVADAPAGVAGALLDGAFAALDGGSPLLIVDPDPRRAAVWIAWVTFALPPRQAAAFTFSTFEGRPRDVSGLHAIATTPACDGAAAGGRVARVDVTAAVEGSEPSLYARASTALAAQGAEALASAVRRVRDDDRNAAGASLVIEGRVGEVVAGDDLGPVLDALLVRARAGDLESVGAATAAIPPAGAADRLHLRAWSDLHRAARAAEGDAARTSASEALARIVAHLDAPLDDLAPVSPAAPTQPAVAGIGSWLRTTEAAQGSDAVGGLLECGARLGLIGLNVAVDDRVAAVIAGELHRPEAVATLQRLEAAGVTRVSERVADRVATDADGSPCATPGLVALAGSEAACRAIRARAGSARTFAAVATWEQIRVIAAPEELAAAVGELARQVRDSREEATVRGLWGQAGPTDPAEIAVLVAAYQAAERPVPTDDVERAFAALMSRPLPMELPPPSDLGRLLAKLPRAARYRPEYYAWSAGLVELKSAPDLEEWTRRTIAALSASPEAIPDDRWSELLRIAAERLVSRRRSDGFAQALADVQACRFDGFSEAVGDTLARAIELAPDQARLAAAEFGLWTCLRSSEVDAEVLPVAFAPLGRSDREAVAELLAPELTEQWEAWSERHPRPGVRTAVTRVLRRRGTREAER
jgi:GTPase-associated protein 1, N-terminal domain type 2/GTPase-associated protein 1, middle domain